MMPTDPRYGHSDPADDGVLGVAGDLTPVRTEVGSYQSFYALLAVALQAGGPVPVDPRESLAAIEIIEQVHRQLSAWGRGRATCRGPGQARSGRPKLRTAARRASVSQPAEPCQARNRERADHPAHPRPGAPVATLPGRRARRGRRLPRPGQPPGW